MDQIKEIYLPRWAGRLYGAMAIILVPWVIILAEYLPTKHLTKDWNTLWVGFDLIMLMTIAITLYFILMKKIWVVITASALATLFIVDAWFDILTARTEKEQIEAIGMGIIEISLAILTYRMVYIIMHQTGHHKNIQIRRAKKPVKPQPLA